MGNFFKEEKRYLVRYSVISSGARPGGRRRGWKGLLASSLVRLSCHLLRGEDDTSPLPSPPEPSLPIRTHLE